VNLIPDDDREDKAAANGFCCRAETLNNQGLREIAFAPAVMALHLG